MLHALDGFELLDEQVELAVVFDKQHHVATEEPIVGIDVDGAHGELVFLGNDVGDIAHDADIVVPNDAQGDGILTRSLATPFGFHHAIAKTFAQFGCVGAGGAVDGDATTHGDEAENIIAIDGMATLCQLIIDAFEVFINHEHIAVVLQKLLVRIFIFKVFGTLGQEQCG